MRDLARLPSGLLAPLLNLVPRWMFPSDVSRYRVAILTIPPRARRGDAAAYNRQHSPHLPIDCLLLSHCRSSDKKKLCEDDRHLQAV